MAQGEKANLKEYSNTKGISTGVIQMFLYMSFVPTIVFILGLMYRVDLILRTLIIFQIIMMLITAINTRGLKLRYLVNVWMGKLITLSILTLTIYISLIVIRDHNILPKEFLLGYLSIVDLEIYKALFKYMLVKFIIEFSFSTIKYLVTVLEMLPKEEECLSGKNLYDTQAEIENEIISDDTGEDGKPKIDTKFYEIEE